MNRYRMLLVIFTLAVALPNSFSAAQQREEVIWAETIDEAWQLAQEHERPMLVFITRKGCKYCTKMKAVTFADEHVAQ